jgi:DNA (cytosine-5)-methyltransferase 1
MSGILDLFCGASGFGLGAELAGFNLKVAVDIDAHVTASHLTNFPNCALKLADLSRVSLGELTANSPLEGERITGIIGGPPCQGFSHMGKRDENDPRNELVGAFFRLVMEGRPKFFVMENVPGILTGGFRSVLDDAIASLNGTYEILGPMLLNAADYGAPTNRKRVVVIGYDRNEFQPITAQNIHDARCQRVSVEEALRDLPEPENAVEGLDGHHWADYPETLELSAYARLMRMPPSVDHSTDFVRAMWLRGVASGLKPTAHTAAVVNRFAALLPGGLDLPSKSRRLNPAGQCVTLRAGTASDKGSFQALRPIHPYANRMITVREAARLQGFPDWFQFHETIWHSFRMIGNSVSPIFAKAILQVIAEKARADVRQAA